MANISKLASTFRAARLKVGVRVDLAEWNELENKLEAMGLEPRVYLIGGSIIWFKVIVPLSFNPLPPHVPMAFVDVINEFDKNAEGLGVGETVDLLCPPVTELVVYKYCAKCGNTVDNQATCSNCGGNYFRKSVDTTQERLVREPCQIAGYLGECQVCKGKYGLIGPIPSYLAGRKPRFLLERHGNALSLCMGSGLLPEEGSVTKNLPV